MSNNLMSKLLIFVTILYTIPSSYMYLCRNKYLNIYFLNVGQGDAILLEYNNSHLLVDGGPGTTINYYLGKLFYPLCSIDGVLLTHPHSDHMSGLDYILDRCDVGVILQSDYNISKVDYVRWLKKIKNKDIKLRYVYRDDLIRFGGFDDLNIYILWPPRDAVEGSIDNLNDTSIVLFIDYYDYEVLLLSDAEKEVQSQLDFDLISELLEYPLEVLKFPHQGSSDALDKDFILSLRPENVVISVGKNSYGHPSEDVINFLEEHNINVYRTDVDGTIKFKKMKSSKESCLFDPSVLLF